MTLSVFIIHRGDASLSHHSIHNRGVRQGNPLGLAGGYRLRMARLSRFLAVCRLITQLPFLNLSQ
ncbi:MAG: hypothetical protein P8Y45_24205 [Exilibacterium sp.]